MVYVVHFFTSDETENVDIALESLTLSVSQLSDIPLIRALKQMVGNDEHLPDSTYALPIIAQWKRNVLSVLKEGASLIPKLNELISFINKIEDGKNLGISFNETLDFFEKKKLLYEMKEREGGLPAKQEYEEFMRKNEMLFLLYSPYSITYKYRTRFGPNERELRICRYCGRKMPDTTFKNVSHTISKSLGNINFITNDECDECNSRFGLGIEREFLDYVSVYRSLAAKFEGHPYYTTKTEAFRLGVDEETNQISFRILDEKKLKIVSSENYVKYIVDGGYINYHNVYRALVKYVIGMLPDNQLPFFKKTISWVNGENIITQLPIVKQTIYNEPEPHPFMNMFFRKQPSDQYPYLVADFHVNHLEFIYVIPGCQQDKKEFQENILDEFLKLRKDHNQWYDLHMNCPQPMHMNLKATYYFKHKTQIE